MLKDHAGGVTIIGNDDAGRSVRIAFTSWDGNLDEISSTVQEGKTSEARRA
jgi:hypothetical protein